MSAVDERVVRMEFDNKQFEQNIKQSIKSLDDLDKQLGLVGEDDAFDNIENKSKKIDFSHLLSGVEKVSSGFNALEAIALGALTRIGSRLTDVISKYAGFFTIRQIGAGWQKFADYSSATQTTLAATAGTWEKEAEDLARIDYLTDQIGDKANAKALNDVFNEYQKGGVKLSTLAKEIGMTKDELSAVFDQIKGVQNTLSHEEFVERAVQQLNWYSDETSYNFTDMISTLGKFTGAGQELMKSTDAIQGMMNMVAVAGGNAEVGQRVAYNLSQAMGAGYLKMIDWKSLQNANVATVAFKDHLLETASAMGVIDKVTKKNGDTVYKYGKETFSATKNFESSLSKGWVTSKVLQATLEDYGKFTTSLYEFTSEYGGTATETLGIIDEYYAQLADGAKQEDITAWNTKMQEMFGDDAEAIAKYEESLKLLGSEEMKFSRDAFKEAQAAKTFRDAIDATADAVSTKWANIFKYMFGNSEKAKEFWSNFTETLYDIFATPLDDVLDIFEKVEKNIRIAIPGVEGTVSAFDLFRESLNNLQQALLTIITPIREAFNQIFMSHADGKITSLALKFFFFTRSLILSDNGAEKLKNTVSGLFTVVRGITKAFKSVFKIVKPIFGLVSPVIRLIGTLISKIGSLVVSFGEVANSDAGSIVNRIAKAVSSAVDWITERLDALTDWIDKNIDFDGLVTVFGTVKKAFVTAWNVISASAQTAWEYIAQYLPTFEEISAFFDSMWQTIQNFLPTWEEIVSALEEGWKWFSKIADTVWKFVKPYIDQLGESLSKFWDKLAKFIDGFIKTDDKMLYLKENILGIVDAFLEWKKNSKFIKWVLGRFEELKKVVLDIKEALKPKEGQSDSGQFFGIAYMVTSLVALLVIMRNVDRISKGFKNITQAIKRFSTAIKRVVTFAGIYLVIRAITKLIESLKIFSELNETQVGSAVLFIIGMLGSLILFAILMNKFVTSAMSEEDIKKFGKMSISLALVLIAVAGALWVLSKSQGLTYEQPLLLIAMLTALVMAAFVLSKYVGDLKFNTILTLVVLAGVLLVAAFAIEKVAKLDATQFEQAKNIVLILAGVAVAAMIVGAILNKGSETMKNIAIAVGAMAASLLIIVIALDQLKKVKMDWQLAGLLLGILAILGILAAIPVYMAKFAKSNNTNSKDVMKMAGVVTGMSVSLLFICAAIGLMAKAMKKYGVSSGDMLKLAAVIFIIGVTLGAMAMMLAMATDALKGSDSKLNDMKKTASAVRSMVVSIILIAAAMVALIKLNITLDKALEPLAILGIIAAGLMVLAAGLAGASKLAGKRGLKSGPIIAMVLGIIALVGTMMVLTKFMEKNGESVWKAVIVIGVIMAALSVMAILMGVATMIAGEKGLQWGAIAAMMLGIMGIAHMMILMSAVPSEQLKTVGKVLGGVIIAVGLMALAIGAMNKMSEGTSVLKTIGLIGAIALALIAAAFAFTMLKDVDSESLMKSAFAIAGVIAVIGILGAVMGSVGGMAAVGVLAIAGAILVISAAFLVVAISANIAAAALPILAAGVVLLGNAVASISATPGQVTALAVTLVFLGIFGTAAMIGIGVGALFMAGAFAIGTFALATLSNILPQLTTGLVMLITALAAMNEIGWQAAAAAGKMAIAFLALMFAGVFLGIGLAAAGVGLGVISLAAMGLATAILIASLGVSTFVASLALLAQGVALVADIFKGGNLSEQVSGFAESVKSGTTDISNSVNELQTTMSNVGSGGGGNGESILSGLIGGEGGPDWASMLNLGGEGGLKDTLTNFIGNEGGIDLKSMLGLNGEDGAGMDWSNVLNLGGENGIMGALSGGIDGIDTGKLSSMFGDKLGGIDFSSKFTELGIGDKFLSGMTSSVSEEGMSDSANNLVDTFTDEMNSPTNMTNAKLSGERLAFRGSDGAYTARSGFQKAGTYCASGFIKGVSDSISSASLVGSKLANALIEAAKATLQVKSPSRVFYEIGMYADMGLARGVADYSDYAAKSASDMALNSIGAVSEILSSTIENDFANPVIRPTLDLSNVTAGAAAISSMFGRQSIGVDEDAYDESENSQNGVVYNYTQNNYSPKALSRIDIYRQTKNLINASQGVG